jgi:glycosyltransferase involved in cell wall biosynthesis
LDIENPCLQNETEMKKVSKTGLSAIDTTSKLKVFYVYKDFDIYNGLIEIFLILSRKKSTLPFDFEVCVFSNKKAGHAEIFRANGGILINLDSRWGSSPAIIYKLYKLFRNARPDVVQTFILKPNLFGIIAAILAKVPVVIATDLTLKDQAPTRLRRLRDRILYRIYIEVANRASQVISVSEAGRKELRGLGLNVGVSVIYPPIDIDEMNKYLTGRKARSTKPRKEVTIGIVARLSEEKRHADLIEAFSLLSKKYTGINLVIVGDGPLRCQLETLTRQLDIDGSVKFVGFQEELHTWLDGMDIFVLPSRTEGAPIAIMQAMVWELPVVASRVGGIPEIVDDEVTGILFEPGNIGELSSALAQLIEDPEKRKVFGENGKKKVYRLFHPDKFIEGHYQLYRALMNLKSNSTSC